MNDGHGRSHRHAVKQERPLGFASYVPDQRHHDDEGDFHEDGDANEKRCDQKRPRRAVLSKFLHQPVGQDLRSAGMFEEASDHRAQSHHHYNEAERIAETGLDGLENFFRGHVRGEAERHARQKQRQEGMQFDGEDQDQKKDDRNCRKENKIITVDGHPVHSNAKMRADTH